MAAIHPYLTFNGNTEEAFNFYKSVFGGEFAGGINASKIRRDVRICLRKITRK